MTRKKHPPRGTPSCGAIVASLASILLFVGTNTWGTGYFVLPKYPKLLRMARSEGDIHVNLSVVNGTVMEAVLSRHTLRSPSANRVPWQSATPGSVQSFLSAFRLWIFDEDIDGVYEVRVILRLTGDPEMTHEPTHHYGIQMGPSGVPAVINVEVPPLPVIPTG
jgi:hypothetical protein